MILKEGFLYKRRDHFSSSWLERYFILDSNFLSYFTSHFKEEEEEKEGKEEQRFELKKRENNPPKRQLKISKDLKINNKIKKEIKNKIFYCFSIENENPSVSYNLSTEVEREYEEWISILQDLINQKKQSHLNEESFNSSPSSFSSLRSNENPLERHLNQKKLSTLQTTTSPSSRPPTNNNNHNNNNDILEENLDLLDDFSPLQRHLTLKNLSNSMITQIENSVEKILQFSINCTESWRPMFEKNGVIASKRPGDGLICVRGETIIPYTILEIYEFISKIEKRKELDPQIDTYTRIKWFSYHSGLEHILFKAIWPTAARDFCNITHWRLLKNGTFITLGWIGFILMNVKLGSSI